MPEDIIRRNYFPVEVGLIDHDKWAGLTWAERGKWIAVRALAERQAVRGTFTNRALLERLLRKEGDKDAETTVSKLIEIKLLDLDDEGVVRIHDRDDWAATSTKRVQRYRERLETIGNVDNPVETVENVPETDETFHPLHETTGNGREQDGTNETRSEEIRESPPTPSRGGSQGSRANGTNPRALAALAREKRKREAKAAEREQREKLAEASSKIEFRSAMSAAGLSLDTKKPKA